MNVRMPNLCCSNWGEGLPLGVGSDFDLRTETQPCREYEWLLLGKHIKTIITILNLFTAFLNLGCSCLVYNMQVFAATVFTCLRI